MPGDLTGHRFPRAEVQCKSMLDIVSQPAQMSGGWVMTSLTSIA